MARESVIQSAVLEYLNRLPGCVAENVQGNAAQRGRADISGSFRGRAFRIELKSPDNPYYTATKLQMANLRRWARAGALCFVANSLDDVKAIINNEEKARPEAFTGIMVVNRRRRAKPRE